MPSTDEVRSQITTAELKKLITDEVERQLERPQQAILLQIAEINAQLSIRTRAMKVEIEREDDGRWIAEVPELPGVLVYGTSEAEARAKAMVLALRVIADRLEAGEAVPFDPDLLFAAAE